MTTLFDTNDIIAVLNPEEPHYEWAVAQLEICKANGPVLVSDVVYSELSVGMASKDDLDAAMIDLGFERLPANDHALFNAGQAYKLYKSRKGTKTNVLPDFFIGAAAAAEGMPLVTANPKDFAGYFPDVQLLVP